MSDYSGIRCKDCSKAEPREKVAHYFETFNGKDYYRDDKGNIYTEVSGRVAFCSNLKKGSLTLDKSEPYYEVSDVKLIKESE